MSTWKVVVVLTVAGIAPAGIAPVGAQRHGRIEVPRIQVDIPTINVRVPAVSVNVPRVRVRESNVHIDIPEIRIDVPEIPVVVPAMNFDFPGIRIDLPDFGKEIDRAIREATRDLGNWNWDGDEDFERDAIDREVSSVRRLQREWREAIREADTTGDWSHADALARRLTRAADRLKR